MLFSARGLHQGLLRHEGTVESRGHEMYYSKNYWADPEYKGINTRWVTPEGQRFEVQFHTPDSFHAKHQVTHLAYERIRDRRRAGPNSVNCTRSSAKCHSGSRSLMAPPTFPTLRKKDSRCRTK